MAITAYTGVSGAGKSYAIVSEVIVPAIRDGRRVVTNVAGLKVDAIYDYIEKNFPKRASQLGEVVVFDGYRTLDAGFFPDHEKPEQEAFVQGGDLVVFDEVRMYWERTGKFPAAITRFLRYHRHFTHVQTGQAIDVVLATQDAADFHRDFRANIERSYRFKKLNSVGLSKRYAWLMWEGITQRKGHHIGTGGGKYKSEISRLYESYIGGGGQEKRTDRRQNVLAQPKFVLICAGVILGLVLGAWSLWAMFHRSAASPAADVAAVAKAGPASAKASSGPGAIPSVNGAPPISANWRIAGTVQTPSMNVVVLVDRAGNTRFEDPSNFTFQDGRPIVGRVDGERVVPVGMQAAAPSGSMSIFGGASQ